MNDDTPVEGWSVAPPGLLAERLRQRADALTLEAAAYDLAGNRRDADTAAGIAALFRRLADRLDARTGQSD